MTKTVTALLILSVSLLMEQNPIVPPGVYIADPSARVFSDGKLRIYGSSDESTKYCCSHHNRTMETADMKRWKSAENIFAVRRLYSLRPWRLGRGSENERRKQDCTFSDFRASAESGA
jgi:hypothetical protein